MDLSIPGSDFQSPSITSLTPVFGDNVQDLLGVGALHVNPSSIFTVNSIVDVVDNFDGVTTLREAINFANTDAMSDLIVFERSLFSNEQTISLSLGQLDITQNLSIIAQNLSTVDSINSDVDGNFTSNGYNLIGDGTGSTRFGVTGDIVGTSDNPIDPLLDPLDFYGGSTQTIALLPDSLAIDAGDPTVLDTDPTTDGRGFPRVSNGRADIGAFEFS